MAFEKTNTGSLAVNKDKKKDNPDHDKWADAKGSINIEGVEYWLDGWMKTGDKGRWTSLRARRKEAKPVDSTGTAPVNASKDEEDCPF